MLLASIPGGKISTRLLRIILDETPIWTIDEAAVLCFEDWQAMRLIGPERLRELQVILAAKGLFLRATTDRGRAALARLPQP